MKHRTNISLSILTLFLTSIACSLGQNPPQTESSPIGPASVTPTASRTRPNPPPSGDAINPDALEYLGAFRLPGGEDPPQTFAYGGNAMTFNPDGDPTGAADNYPGSLFVMGHDRIVTVESRTAIRSQRSISLYRLFPAILKISIRPSSFRILQT